MDNKRFVDFETSPFPVCAYAQKRERLFQNQRSIPPTTKLSTVLVGVSWRFR
jgi:hypothetical protein